MSYRKSTEKNLRNIDEIVQQSINDALEKFINDKLKVSIETSIMTTLNNYIDNSVELDDPKQIIRVYYKNTAAIQENSHAVQELHSTVKQYFDKILIEQRQKDGELQRKIQDWEKAAIDFFVLLERAIDCESNDNRRSIEKILAEFEHTIINLGLERIVPQQDELLNERFHEAVEEEESAIAPGNILRCTNWGYRIGDNVIQKAKVIVAKGRKDGSRE
jgi:molecular chaperone GrpE (heat shock protein)